ncbi:MAG: hypothetical protein JO053_02190 [Acidobacteria bacterium]|nr:hypothetical protein [Acidobacteriota bacterium]
MDSLIQTFDRRFVEIDSRARGLLSALNDENLFQRPRKLSNSLIAFSVAEYLIRSAAVVEQAFGGITTRLWDDPFEWTLPEKLSTIKAITIYLNEVAAARKRGMAFLSSDADLTSQIPAPEKLRSIGEILLAAACSAEHYQGRAFALYQVMNDMPLPRI